MTLTDGIPALSIVDARSAHVYQNRGSGGWVPIGIMLSPGDSVLTEIMFPHPRHALFCLAA